MDIFTEIISIGIIFAHIFILFVFYSYLTKKDFKILDFIGKSGVSLAFLTALFSMLISLYYSEIVGFAPCTLCWYQRIFMYSNVFILGLAIFKKDTNAFSYSIFLSIIGAFIAIYHVFIQFLDVESITCGLSSTVSCSDPYILSFGYITIPVMSLTSFILMIIFLLLAQKHGNNT